MASPSFAEVWSQIKNGYKILDETRKYGAVNATNLIGLIDTHSQSLEGDFAADGGVGARRHRAALASALASGREIIDPHLFDMAKVILSDARSAEGILADLYKYMVDNSQTLKSRVYSFGAISAGGSNVGNGTIYRLTVDRYNKTIEASFLTVTSAKCVVDRQSGTLPGREEFTMYQNDPYPDMLEYGTGSKGSGSRSTLVAHAGDEIIKNASFQNLEGTAANPTAIPNWTSSVTVSSTNFSFDETNYFRKSPEEAASGGTPRALNIKATCTLQQKFSTLGVALSPDTPYVAAVRWNRQVGSGAGTLTLRWGDKSVAVVAAAQTGWQTLVAVMDQDTWLRQFNEDDADFMIDWARTSGDLLVDDAIFGPMTRFDSLWYFALGGATNFQKDDIFTFTDTETGAINQRWTSWLYPGFYLPAVGGAAETIADP